MSSRDFILDRVRRNQPQGTALPTLPVFERATTGLLEAFGAALARMGGTLVEAPAEGTLDGLIRQRFATARVVCSATPEVQGTRPLREIRDARELEDVDVGVVRARFGVAETGSVCLSEREFGINALGFLPQHLVVLLDPRAIVPDLHHAYRERDFFEARYAALMTGPSATADIEGILIRGAQGIRSLTVIGTAPPHKNGFG
jgi:L-lactate dehydrogenase complex protein LldG